MSLTPERWRRITDLFHAVRARDAADRAAFLDRECGGDAELRREVEAMVTADRGAGDFGAAPLGGSTMARRLTTGCVLGPYRIDGFIGAGGMGDVYRARDTRLGRDVAVKVLPAEFAADPERLHRFEQEARASGALNHPNVVTLYDVGTIEGQPYLVAELLDGETLRDRIGHGPLPARRACEIAADVARGLAAAHAKGIVHRDLKPENVMVTRDGRVKILDFGIAKLRPPDADADARTMTTPLRTLPDTVMGTAGYMAPEQIRGEPVDARADIFALGAMTFELLAGRRPFDRATRIETLNAVLHDDAPSLADASLPIPPAIGPIVRRCLEKDPDARFQSARDLAFAFDASSDTGAVVQSASRNRASLAWPVAFAAALVAVIAGALWVNARRQPPASREVTRFVVQPPASHPINGVRYDISPDGRLIAYRGDDNGVARLFIRRLDQFDPVALPGTERGSGPFFSPDGQWLAFFAENRRLMKIDIAATAPPIVLQETPGALDGSWPTADTILYGTIEQGIRRISSEGGAPTVITSPEASRHEFDHHTPRMLPGGRWLLFTSHEGAEVFRVVALELATGKRKVLIESGFDARYSATGHLVYASGSSLYAVPFDVDGAELTGVPVKMVDEVAAFPDSAVGGYAISSDGTLAYAVALPTTGRTLAWVDRSGKEAPLAVGPRAFRSVRLSPDDRRVAMAVVDGDREDIWIQELQGDALARITFQGQNREPRWTPDGERLTYTALRDGVQHLTLQLGGGGGVETLVSSRNNLAAGAWSPDGRTLAYVDSPPTDFSAINVVVRDGTWRSTPLITRTVESPTLSPDGRWIAFASSDDNPKQIIVQPFPGLGPRHQVTTDGGGAPIWSRAGNEIFYASGNALFAVPVDTSRGFRAGKPVRLFEGRYVYSSLMTSSYDASRDGRRFLMIKPGEAERAPREVRVVVNWADELTRRVPVR